jgi:hypothetical protein
MDNSNSDDPDLIEIAPGIHFKKDLKQLCILDNSEELIGWDYDEICNSSQMWLDTLQAVVMAVRSGPTAVREYVKKKKAEISTPGSILCNVCERKFVVGPEHPYALTVKLNNKNYYEFQCSEGCNKKRRIEVYDTEMGEDFMKLWQTKFS